MAQSETSGVATQSAAHLVSVAIGMKNTPCANECVCGGDRNARDSFVMRLPNSVWFNILSFIPADDIVSHVMLTSTHLASQIQSNDYCSLQWGLYLTAFLERLVLSPSGEPIALDLFPSKAANATGERRRRFRQHRAVRSQEYVTMDDVEEECIDEAIREQLVEPGFADPGGTLLPVPTDAVQVGSLPRIQLYRDAALRVPLSPHDVGTYCNTITAAWQRNSVDGWGLQRVLVSLHRMRAIVDDRNDIRLRLFGPFASPSLEKRIVVNSFCASTQRTWSSCVYARNKPAEGDNLGRSADTTDANATATSEHANETNPAEAGRQPLRCDHDGVVFSTTIQPRIYEDAETSNQRTNDVYARFSSEAGNANAEDVMWTAPFTSQDMITYYFLLAHTAFTDVHVHKWGDEEKHAICSSVVSPFGGGAELRFFISSLDGPYPRLYIRCFATEGDLPLSVMMDRMDSENGLYTLFTGGYGRVEVDIAPTVSRTAFDALRKILRLPPSFPGELLWNVVMHATGDGELLRIHSSSFITYYRKTFADVARDVLHAASATPRSEEKSRNSSSASSDC